MFYFIITETKNNKKGRYLIIVVFTGRQNYISEHVYFLMTMFRVYLFACVDQIVVEKFLLPRKTIVSCFM